MSDLSVCQPVNLHFKRKNPIKYTITVGNWDWDFVCEYSTEFRLFFVKTITDVTEMRKIEPRIEVAFNNYGRVLYLHIAEPESSLACHFYETLAVVDGKHPMQMSCRYSKEGDILDIYLIDPLHLPEVIESTDEVYPNILVGEDNQERILKITIMNASRLLEKQHN
eukprot:TRINITY_DN12566_c0_g1_i1.p1 TRINITY_DN12566_c0_g1~~TRINITY_DN12566_c0_g1_i1.p1  ORF type:complete len:166 (-),score=29.95 TRINITY_DN12566_c0_g1_i1:61-558(-)